MGKSLLIKITMGKSPNEMVNWPFALTFYATVGEASIFSSRVIKGVRVKFNSVP
jgi:hypothetical protein